MSEDALFSATVVDGRLTSVPTSRVNPAKRFWKLEVEAMSDAYCVETGFGLRSCFRAETGSLLTVLGFGDKTS